MAFASFSRGYVSGGYTLLSNIFIEEHLPHSNGDCVLVYLYGLYLCEHATSADNTIEHMSTILGIPAINIKDAFEYWEEQGLVEILHTVPMEIKFWPIKRNSAKVRKLPKGEYDGFNTQAQALLDGRMVTTTEFNEYYAFMKSMKFEPNALLVVIKNCVELKGFTVGYNYILTVAKHLAYDGLTTHKAVSEKFEIDRSKHNELEKLIKGIRKNKVAPKEFIKHSYDPSKIKEIGTNEIEF